jgi:hypothetical protein
MQYVESAALREQLTVLTENFPQLGRRLSLAAQELQDSGVPCEHAVQDVWALFNSEGEFFSTDEQSPRVLIGADLLRVPFLKLNDQGEVEDSDPESLVDVVLDLLVNGLLESASA